MEVNGQSFEHSTKYARAIEVLKSVCHLSITVKSNLLAFQDMLQNLEDGPKNNKSRKSQNNLLIESSVDGGSGGAPGGETFSHGKREMAAAPVTRSKKESAVMGMGIAATGASGKFLAISSRQLFRSSV